MLRRTSRLGGITQDIVVIMVPLVTRTTRTSLDSLNITANVTSRPPRVVCGKPNGGRELECNFYLSVIRRKLRENSQ
ncbi:hypothetical protein M0804_009979 [Polistes exclamans]|nr:hypothetical protein M0804_009979 [Polistes exclamans]